MLNDELSGWLKKITCFGIDYYCRTRQTDKTPHSVLEKMKEAENFSYSMNFGHFSIQVGISPSEVISAQKMKWAVKLWSSGYALN